MNNELPEGAYPVLGNGYVNLLRHTGDDNSIIRSASKGSAYFGKDEDADLKFIAALLRSRNTDPFDAVRLSFEIKAPIFVFQNWNQHREWAYAEVSGGYSKIGRSFYVPGISALMASGVATISEAELIRPQIVDQYGLILARYHALVAYGCPQVYCDSILPVATYAHMHIEYNLSSLFNFLRHRINKTPSFEVKVVVGAMLLLAEDVAPIAVKAFREQL